MSIPKNNLADLLQRKANNSINSAQKITPPARSTSGVRTFLRPVYIYINVAFQKPKFKPATFTPSGGTIREYSNTYLTKPKLKGTCQPSLLRLLALSRSNHPRYRQAWCKTRAKLSSLKSQTIPIPQHQTHSKGFRVTQTSSQISPPRHPNE